MIRLFSTNQLIQTGTTFSDKKVAAYGVKRVSLLWLHMAWLYLTSL